MIVFCVNTCLNVWSESCVLLVAMQATGQEIRNVAINRTGVGSWGFQTDTCRQFPEVNRLEDKRVADYALRRDRDQRDTGTTE